VNEPFLYLHFDHLFFVVVIVAVVFFFFFFFFVDMTSYAEALREVSAAREEVHQKKPFQT
jgi:hypothetical protein